MEENENANVSEGIRELLDEARGAKRLDDLKKAGDADLVQCPCCGERTLMRPVEAKGEALERFLACIMTGTPFSNAYRLFDGKVTVIVCNPDNSERYMLDKAAAALSGADAPKVCKALLNILRTLMFVDSVSVCGMPGQEPAAFRPKAHVKGVIAALEASGVPDEKGAEAAYLEATSPKVVSGMPMSTLQELIHTHVNLHNILLESGFDSTFWKGIELA